MENSLKEIYLYRNMIYNLVKKDLRTRYKGTVLGFFWTFINPLLQLLIYSLLFSTIMRINLEQYELYLFIGLIPWMFLATALPEAARSIITNQNLIKKIYFPRAVIPLSVVTSAFVNMIFSMLVVLAALMVSGRGVSINVIYLPLIMMIEYLFVLGIAMIVSAVTVYFRDVEHILGIIIMGWFYATPIVYTMEYVPQKFLWLFNLNPMLPIINGYHDILYWKRSPDILDMGLLIVGIMIVLIIGYGVFQKLQKNFVEEI